MLLKPLKRRQILAYLTQRINISDNDDLLERVRRYCKTSGIALRERDLQALVDEAYRVRIDQRIKALNQKIISYHPES